MSNNDYRREARQVAKDTRWTVWRFLPIFLFVVVILSGIGFALNSLGIIGRTVVEREVFEQSYQRQEALRLQIATDEAVLAEIELQLENPNLDEGTRSNLEAQAAAVRVRLQTTREMQQ